MQRTGSQPVSTKVNSSKKVASLQREMASTPSLQPSAFSRLKQNSRTPSERNLIAPGRHIHRQFQSCSMRKKLSKQNQHSISCKSSRWLLTPSKVPRTKSERGRAFSDPFENLKHTFAERSGKATECQAYVEYWEKRLESTRAADQEVPVRTLIQMRRRFAN